MEKNLANFLVPTDEIDSRGQKIVDLDRKAFRKHSAFSWAYSGLEEDNFEEIYKRLYLSYEKVSELITIEPAPIKPKEFDKVITDEDVLDLENCLAMMFTMGLNFVASQLDQSAGRPFIPRNPTTDGSYETARKGLAENQ